MRNKQRAIINISFGALERMLQLPEGCEIASIRERFGYNGVAQLIVEGAGGFVSEGTAMLSWTPAIELHTTGEFTLVKCTYDSLPGPLPE